MQTKRVTTFKHLCEEYNCNYANALYQRKQHPTLSNEEVIKLCCVDKMTLSQEERDKFYTDKKKPFRVLCMEKGIDFTAAYMFKSRHPDWSDEDIVVYYLKKDLKKKCKSAKVEYSRAIEVMEKHTDFTNDAIIKYIKEND